MLDIISDERFYFYIFRLFVCMIYRTCPACEEKVPLKKEILSQNIPVVISGQVGHIYGEL